MEAYEGAWVVVPKVRASISNDEVEVTAPISLPLDAPVAALRAAAGLSAGELAERRGCSRAAVFQAEGRGGSVTVATLEEWARSAGYEIEIVARKVE